MFFLYIVIYIGVPTAAFWNEAIKPVPVGTQINFSPERPMFNS